MYIYFRKVYKLNFSDCIMKRKLVRQGAATMMISLPSKWIKENGFGKGDELELEPRGRDIILSSGGNSVKSQTEINISSLTESSIRTIVTNAYRLGYDKIIVKFHDAKVIDIIRNVIDNNLLGFEIISKSVSGCEIENITEPSKDQFDNIFSKIFLNIDELFEVAGKMSGKEIPDFESIEHKIKQFDNFCRRVISKQRFPNSKLQWAFHSELIHAQREIYHLLKFLSKNKQGVKSLGLLNDCKKVFQLLKKGYNEKDISALEKIHELEKQLVYHHGYNSMKRGSSNSVVLYHLMSAIRGFYLASSPLIGIIVSQEV